MYVEFKLYMTPVGSHGSIGAYFASDTGLLNTYIARTRMTDILGHVGVSFDDEETLRWKVQFANSQG